MPRRSQGHKAHGGPCLRQETDRVAVLHACGHSDILRRDRLGDPPPECGHVYFMYNVRFDPRLAGAECEPRRFRIAVEKALYREGLLVGQWQTMPVPAQDLFQSRLGYGGTGFPWSINEARGIRYDYDPSRYAEARRLCDTYTIVHGVHAPNDRALMEKIVVGFGKVFGSIDAAIAHADDPIYPGADGALYGAA